MFMDGTDKRYMEIAIGEAEKSLESGDFPTGAVLVFNGKLIDQSRNSIYTDKKWTAHAEHKLLVKNSEFLMGKYRKSLKDPDFKYNPCVYTTLEPCVMCYGICVMHRVKRIVFGCNDPFAGCHNVIIQRDGLYGKIWPKISRGIYEKESCDLVLKFSKTKKAESWEDMLIKFQKIRDNITK